MWRSAQMKLLVAVAVMCVVVSGSAQQGDGTADDDPREVPGVLVDVYVGPLIGPMHIPPVDRPSQPYTASIRFFDGEVAEMREFWSFPRKTMYAGDSVNGEGEYGPYRITYSVTIDERGDMAEVQIKYEWMDGDELARVALQRFTAHLPPSQMLPG